MSQAPPLTKNETHNDGQQPFASTQRLRQALRDTSQRWRNATLLSFVLVWIAVWTGSLLIAVTLDASFAFPAWALVILDAVLLTLAAGISIAALRTVLAAKHDARRVAVAIEQHGQIKPSQLINAIDLDSTENPSTANTTSPALRRLAIKKGEDAASKLNPSVLVNRTTLKRHLAAAVIAMLLVGIGIVFAPRVFSAVGPRLLSPWSDLPPYTPLWFEVAVGPEVIYLGKPGVVEVTITHPNIFTPLPTEATIVFVDKNQTKLTSPMHRSIDKDDGHANPGNYGKRAAPENFNDEISPTPQSPTRFTYRFERLDVPITFYIDTPDGRSKRYTITPDTTPLFESLHATLAPPDYTRFKTTTQRLDTHLRISEKNEKTTENKNPSNLPHSTSNNIPAQNILHALRGTAITLTTQSNVPIAIAELRSTSLSNATPTRTTPPLSFPNTNLDKKSVVATFIVKDSGTYELTLIGQDGKASTRPIHLAVTALTDYAPSVDIVSPEPLALAVEGWPVPVQIAAKDDVGLQSLKLHTNLSDRQLNAIDLLAPSALSTATPRAIINTQHILDLALLEAKPGDTLKFFATTRDNLPTAQGGPPHDLGQPAETPIFQIQVISQDEWNQIARTQYGIEQMQAELQAIQAKLDKLTEARQDILEQLDKLQDKTASGEPLNDVEKQQLQKLQEQLEAFADDAKKLAEALKERAEQPDIYDFEEPFNEQLRELAEQLEAQAKQAKVTQQAASKLSLPGVTPTQLDDFSEQAETFKKEDQPFDESMQQEMELLAEDLMKFELADEMVFHAERIRQVVVQQRELEVKLSELQWREPEDLSADESQRLAKYTLQERTMRDELEDAALMLRETAELAGPLLPKMSTSAIALCESLDELLVYPDMEAIADYAQQLETAMAHASGQIAADKLETLLSDTNNVHGESDGDLDGCLSLPKAKIGSAMQQMSNARKRGLGQKQNGQGHGQSGSRANASLVGPRKFSRGDSNTSAGANANRSGQHSTLLDRLTVESIDAESLNPDTAAPHTRSAISVPGVPARYQDIAAAYFQRLAEEAARANK